MVDEYLSEREQADQLKRWFKEYWIWLVVGIALGFGYIYGWRAWESHKMDRSAEAEQQFSMLLATLGRDEREQGVLIAAEITKHYADTPYSDQAELVMARVDIEAGDLDQAALRLAAVMNSSRDDELRLVARLRLVRVQLAQGKFDDALATLDAVEPAAVSARVAEMRGDVLQARGDEAGALAAYRSALAAATGDSADLVDAELLDLKIDALAARLEAP